MAVSDDDDDDVVNKTSETGLSSTVRRLLESKLNVSAGSYFLLVLQEQLKFEPFAVRNKTEKQLNNTIEQPLQLAQPYDNKAVEWHIEMNSKAWFSVVGCHRHDGMI